MKLGRKLGRNSHIPLIHPKWVIIPNFLKPFHPAENSPNVLFLINIPQATNYSHVISSPTESRRRGGGGTHNTIKSPSNISFSGKLILVQIYANARQTSLKSVTSRTEWSDWVLQLNHPAGLIQPGDIKLSVLAWAIVDGPRCCP